MLGKRPYPEQEHTGLGAQTLPADRAGPTPTHKAPQPGSLGSCWSEQLQTAPPPAQGGRTSGASKPHHGSSPLDLLPRAVALQQQAQPQASGGPGGGRPPGQRLSAHALPRGSGPGAPSLHRPAAAPAWRASSTMAAPRNGAVCGAATAMGGGQQATPAAALCAGGASDDAISAEQAAAAGHGGQQRSSRSSGKRNKSNDRRGRGSGGSGGNGNGGEQGGGVGFVTGLLPKGAPSGSGSGRGAPCSRPTHFLAVRMAHEPTVVSAIQQVQASLVGCAPGLAAACEPPEKAHVTLMVMALAEDRDCRQGCPPPPRLVAALRTMATLPGALEAAGEGAPLQLAAKGLGSFGGKVLFLEVAENGNEGTVHGGCSALVRLQACVAQHFQELRFDHKPFEPHITIAKMSKMQFQQRRRKPWWADHGRKGKGGKGKGDGRGGDGEAGAGDERLRGIPRSAYEAHVGIDAGVVTVQSVELCAMTGRQPGSFYRVLAAVTLQAPDTAGINGQDDPRVTYSRDARDMLDAAAATESCGVRG